jgi:hypothetical protein
MADHDLPSCPFCPFSDEDASFVSEHIEYCHPESCALPASLDSNAFDTHSPSPLSPPVEDATDKYVDCPQGCGEIVTAVELSNHLDMHIAEGIALDDGTGEEPFPEDQISSDHDLSGKDDSFDLPTSRKNDKRGSDRGFAKASTSKVGRARSPLSEIGQDGAKRLGVSDHLQAEILCGIPTYPIE